MTTQQYGKVEGGAGEDRNQAFKGRGDGVKLKDSGTNIHLWRKDNVFHVTVKIIPVRIKNLLIQKRGKKLSGAHLRGSMLFYQQGLIIPERLTESKQPQRSESGSRTRQNPV